jgi:hypothetical protein
MYIGATTEVTPIAKPEMILAAYNIPTELATMIEIQLRKNREKELNIVFLGPKRLAMKPEGSEPTIAPAEARDSIQFRWLPVMLIRSLVAVCRYVSLQGAHVSTDPADMALSVTAIKMRLF